jgi:alkylation response protein AidB-like acyl-CoA dehydrogenase
MTVWSAASPGWRPACHSVAEEYGGAGVDDFRFPTVLIEELAKGLVSALGFYVHSEMVVPYIQDHGSAEQKQRWLAGCVDGSIISAVAMSEPRTGSDLSGIATNAVRDGDFYVLYGAKTVISQRSRRQDAPLDDEERDGSWASYRRFCLDS